MVRTLWNMVRTLWKYCTKLCDIRCELCEIWYKHYEIMYEHCKRGYKHCEKLYKLCEKWTNFMRWKKKNLKIKILRILESTKMWELYKNVRKFFCVLNFKFFFVSTSIISKVISIPKQYWCYKKWQKKFKSKKLEGRKNVSVISLFKEYHNYLELEFLKKIN